MEGFSSEDRTNLINDDFNKFFSPSEPNSGVSLGHLDFCSMSIFFVYKIKKPYS